MIFINLGKVVFLFMGNKCNLFNVFRKLNTIDKRIWLFHTTTTDLYFIFKLLLVYTDWFPSVFNLGAETDIRPNSTQLLHEAHSQSFINVDKIVDFVSKTFEPLVFGLKSHAPIFDHRSVFKMISGYWIKRVIFWGIRIAMEIQCRWWQNQLTFRIPWNFR